MELQCFFCKCHDFSSFLFILKIIYEKYVRENPEVFSIIVYFAGKDKLPGGIFPLVIFVHQTAIAQRLDFLIAHPVVALVVTTGF